MTAVFSWNTPLGPATAAARKGAIVGFWFDGQARDRSALQGAADVQMVAAGDWASAQSAFAAGDWAVLSALGDWVSAYFAGENPAIAFALAPEGSAFQREIWRMLRAIPYGACTTYGALAHQYAGAHGLCAMSAQAVGGAVGRNPISLLIPCHRVLGANGALTGYAGGLDKKIALLRLEGADFRAQAMP
ncbi:MAG: methylated-DNA--[protein]-cysteine S-methyltransferase [Clostridia bacterium]